MKDGKIAVLYFDPENFFIYASIIYHFELIMFYLKLLPQYREQNPPEPMIKRRGGV